MYIYLTAVFFLLVGIFNKCILNLCIFDFKKKVLKKCTQVHLMSCSLNCIGPLVCCKSTAVLCNLIYALMQSHARLLQVSCSSNAVAIEPPPPPTYHLNGKLIETETNFLMELCTLRNFSNWYITCLPHVIPWLYLV